MTYFIVALDPDAGLAPKTLDRSLPNQDSGDVRPAGTIRDASPVLGP